MNNLKKILQLVVDYYNEVCVMHKHIISIVCTVDVQTPVIDHSCFCFPPISGPRSGNFTLPAARFGPGSRTFRPCGDGKTAAAHPGLCC